MVLSPPDPPGPARGSSDQAWRQAQRGFCRETDWAETPLWDKCVLYVYLF